MSFPTDSSFRRLKSFTVLMVTAVLVLPVRAADSAPDAAAASSPSMTVSMIKRLVEKGALSKKDAATLLLLAEADAAEARAQAAQTQAALAQLAAMQARARAKEALASDGQPELAAVASSNSTTAIVTAEARPDLPSVAASIAVDEVAEPPARPAASPHKTATRTAPAPVAEQDDTPVPAPIVARAKPVAPADDAADDANVPDDTVRVTYVPTVVAQQLREQVKEDVLDEARKEGWATPQSVPQWVTQFRLFGDFRFRYEGIRFPSGNNNTGAFPNFNAINTGAPFDTSGSVFSPQFDVDQDRSRLRLRARMGAGVDLGENWSVGMRLATGDSNSPVTANQSLGAAGSGQGGNFSKYAIWLDRAFLRYETGGLPDQDLSVSLGRFDNPFMSTAMVWADDLGFDGAVVQGKYGVSEAVTPFLVAGAFPVFNTDLNFATNQPAKFKSDDKWLYAAQLGTTWELGKDVSLKVAAAYYQFQNIEGQLSTPFTPLTAADAGDTDASRPAFAQKGNTYMALRDILPKPGDAASGGNQNGTINQFQYFGLASRFRDLSFEGRLDFNHFEPVQISLTGEYIKNLAFDEAAIAAIAINNLGAPTTAQPNGAFVGGNTAWLVRLTVGDVVLQKKWDWSVNLGYRKVDSDALVDGFADADFGGGGTNVQGFTLGGNLALSKAVSVGLRWFSSSQVAGPLLKSDIVQFDFNGKF